MTKAEELFEFINTNISNGNTVVISTPYVVREITPKTVASFKAVGFDMFKMAHGNLMLVRKRKFDTICTPTHCLVSVKAYSK